MEHNSARVGLAQHGSARPKARTLSPHRALCKARETADAAAPWPITRSRKLFSSMSRRCCSEAEIPSTGIRACAQGVDLSVMRRV